ncbi:MAG: aldo/keto reductase [Phycisphaerae bacterium]
MKTVQLGSTGIEVSELCFGTMSFGGDADEAMSGKMFNRCREAGINFFDCANVYAGGKSEMILGKRIADCREQLVITSKVATPVGEGPNSGGLSRRHIHQQIDLTLQRLGTDRLDVYFCHHFDPKTPLEVTFRAFEDLIRAGKILHVGLSNWSAWQIALAIGTCRQLGLSTPAVLQPMYSLAKRTCEIEILPLAADQNLGVIPYSPLGGGLLTGKYLGGRDKVKGRIATNQMYAKRYGDQKYDRVAADFVDYAEKSDHNPVTLAVAWVKAHPAVTAPIIGARNLDQLEDSLAAADLDLSETQRQEITDLTPPVPLATDRTEEKDR